MAKVLNEQEAKDLTTKLCKQLDARAQGIEKLERYYDGKHNLRFATRKFREAFGALFREFADNWCGVIVDATTERMRIEGFRLPTPKKEQEVEEARNKAQQQIEERTLRMVAAEAHGKAMATASLGSGAPSQATGSATGAPEPPPAMPIPADEMGDQIIVPDANTGDPEAWDIWQRNQLDLYADIAHETMLITGYAYILVGPEDDGSTDNPLITVEHPLEMITRGAPGNVRKVTAAVKRWWDEETGYTYATLYTPDAVWRFQSVTRSKRGIVRQPRWVPRDGLPTTIPNPFDGIVPVVPLVNRQKMSGHGRSEIADVIPIQDAINKLTNDMLVASEFAAFRQRLLTGMEVPEDEHGNIIPDFDLKAAVNRLMIVKDDNVGVHEFGVTDLGQYVKAIEHLRDDMAAITRTPPQYLVGQVVNVSGDALKAAESGLVQKTKRRCRFAGEAWEEVIRLAFLLKGDKERAEAYTAETIWANPEIVTEGALADSLAKYATLGVPPQALWERLGASQTEIERWLQMRSEHPIVLEGTALAGLLKAGSVDPS